MVKVVMIYRVFCFFKKIKNKEKVETFIFHGWAFLGFLFWDLSFIVGKEG